MDWPINPLAFFELIVVLAFAVGYVVLDRFANRYDGRRGAETGDDEQKPPRSDSTS